MEAIAISPAPQPTPQAKTHANPVSSNDNDFGTTLSHTIEQQDATPDQANQANTQQHPTPDQTNQENTQQDPSSPTVDDNPKQDADSQISKHPVPEEQSAGLAAFLPVEQSNQLLPQLNTGLKANMHKLIDPKNTSLANSFSSQNQDNVTNPSESIKTAAQFSQTNFSPEIKPQTEQNNSLLLNKIHQIITNSNETGTVTIRGEQPTTATTINQGTPANIPTIPITEETITQATFSAATNSRVTSETDTNKAISKVTLLRQDGQQVVQQEIKLDNPQNSGQNLQQSFNESAGGQQTLAGGSTLASMSTDSSNSFAQIVTQVADTNSQLQQVNSKAGLATPNTAFQENEVMNQVIQRFNVNPRLQTSKLSIQLTPVELGQLKIDILIKGDSIKANIVAQSQHATEIIEKNMVKLKTVLEDQGFTIDELIVSTVQDDGESFNLFQENYSQPEQSNQNNKKNFSASNFEIPLDELLPNENTGNSSGVNVKI